MKIAEISDAWEHIRKLLMQTSPEVMTEEEMKEILTIDSALVTCGTIKLFLNMVDMDNIDDVKDTLNQIKKILNE